MNSMLKIFLLMVLCLLPQRGVSQEYLNTISDLIWERNEFREALNSINQHRARATKNTFILDLYKSACYCGLRQYNDGHNYYQWILKAYRNLDSQIVNYINQCKIDCRQQEINPQPPSQSLLATINIISPPGPAKVVGKEFYNLQNEFSQTRIIREIPHSIYQQRLYEDVEITTLMQQLKNTGIDTGNIYTSAHFNVIIPWQVKKENNAQNIGELLEKALHFYQAFYDVLLPPHKITAYSCTDQSQFFQLAELLHGVKLNQSLIGYSSQPDLSMVVYNPYLNAATLKHELVHILFNYNLPYLEPWLAEGIPALYEVSRFQDDVLSGIPAWRDKLLSQVGHAESMDLESMLGMDWNKFEEWESQENNSMSKTCLARTFVLYLQQKGKLKDVFTAYRNQDPTQYDSYLVTSVLDNKMPQIQSDFDSWFDQLH